MKKNKVQDIDGAAVNKIQRFDPTDNNILTDAEYESDPQRSDGYTPGLFRSKLTNKVLKQASAITSALGSLLAQFSAKDITDAITDNDFADAMVPTVGGLIKRLKQIVLGEDAIVLNSNGSGKLADGEIEIVHKKGLNKFQTGRTFRCVACSSSGQYILAGCADNMRLYISSDYGVSYEIAVVQNCSCDCAAMSADGSLMIAGHPDGGGFLVSKDYGANWNKVVNAAYTVSDIACSHDGSIAYAITNTTVYKSTDKGDTWNKIATAPAITTGSSVCCSADGKTVYIGASGDSKYLYKSTNSGTSWGAAITAVSYIRVVRCSDDGNTVVVGTGDASKGYVSISIDGGTSWNKCDALGTSEWLGVAISSSGQTLMATATALTQDINVSYDCGKTWGIIPQDETHDKAQYIQLAMSANGGVAIGTSVNGIHTWNMVTALTIGDKAIILNKDGSMSCAGGKAAIDKDGAASFGNGHFTMYMTGDYSGYFIAGNRVTGDYSAVGGTGIYVGNGSNSVDAIKLTPTGSASFAGGVDANKAEDLVSLTEAPSGYLDGYNRGTMYIHCKKDSTQGKPHLCKWYCDPDGGKTLFDYALVVSAPLSTIQDARIKEGGAAEVMKPNLSLNILEDLQPIKYKHTDKDNCYFYGFEIEKFMDKYPELCEPAQVSCGSDNPYREINDVSFIALLIQVCKDQQSLIETLNDRVKKLEK